MVQTKRIEIEDPPVARWLFTSTASSVMWLLLRLYLGYEWFKAATHIGMSTPGKIADPKWMVTGEALKAYWERAIGLPPAVPTTPITFDWYRSFLEFLVANQAYVWFAKVIAIGELLIGIALILGVFTGVAAFFGAFMNWNFMMAGSASTNPLLFAIAIAIMLAWKVAGYYGLDRWVLPALGTPWQLGMILSPRRPEQAIPVAGTA